MGHRLHRSDRGFKLTVKVETLTRTTAIVDEMSRVFFRNVTMPVYRKTMMAKSRAALLALSLFAGGCADRGHAVALRDVEPLVARPVTAAELEAARGVDAPVVIISLDGVRWQEVFQGTDRARSGAPPVASASIFKNLHELAFERGGVVGAPGIGTIAASGPNFVSLPGYTEMLGGRPSRCTDNDCVRTALPSILDEARAAGAKVAAFASWEKLDLAATSMPGAFYSSCGRHGDSAIDPWPGHGDYRPDARTADAALQYYESEQPDVFYLGLGDPDEYAHRDDYPGYLVSLRRADEIIGRFRALLHRIGERGERTHVVVTTDHGRADDFKDHGGMPESARVWMVAAGPRFLARGAVSSPGTRHLADIAPTLRVVLGLPPDTSERAGVPISELF